MLSRRIASAATRSAVSAGAKPLPLVQRRTFFPPQMNSPKVIDEKYPDHPKLTEAEDPGQNGGYINPPAVKRQFRDPYGDWWDKQERRNFGEPVHEDNDILGMLSPYEYTWASTGKSVLLFSSFVATLCSGVALAYYTYPDLKSYPREFEDGLERELGGSGAWRARMPATWKPQPDSRSSSLSGWQDGRLRYLKVERRCFICL